MNDKVLVKIAEQDISEQVVKETSMLLIVSGLLLFLPRYTMVLVNAIRSHYNVYHNN